MFLFKKIVGPLLLPVSVGLEVMLLGLFLFGSVEDKRLKRNEGVG